MGEDEKMKKETKRQIFHFIMGTAIIALLLYYGREFTMVAVFALAIAGLMAINMRLVRMKTVVIEWAEEQFERSNARFTGWGGAGYIAGIIRYQE